MTRVDWHNPGESFIKDELEFLMSDINTIRQSVADSISALESLKASAGVIAAAGDGIVAALKAGNKVLTAGNGGSAAEAMHMAEELIGRFQADRVSLPGLADKSFPGNRLDQFPEHQGA